MDLGMEMARTEISLRISAILVLVLTACVVAFDTQTKAIIFTIEKKASYRDLYALKILVYVTSAAAGYNLLQLCKYPALAYFGGIFKGSYMIVAWISLLLDQIMVYVTFAANSATFEAAMLGVTGAEALQWMKVCNKFTRFCIQIGGALLCCFAASILMAIMASVSAYKLFRMYSPNWFLRLKTK
ncbi:hypothetical protein L6164_014079 [Bauhinia variegata]|uniref:Uncharacterized protein n=1 Tax=Bauhinia variegata TaxID=167791 RepID=A0ACB9NL08_BAUVA|nr:hypothetical protein L6164_014079 [Bauhinia variegata]